MRVSGPGRTIPKGRWGPGKVLPTPNPTPPVPMWVLTYWEKGAAAATGAAALGGGGVQQEVSAGAGGPDGAGSSPELQAIRVRGSESKREAG